MLPVLRTIRVLVISQIFAVTHCQNGFGEQELRLRFASNDENFNTLSFNPNIFQRDTNFQPISNTNIQYPQNIDTNNNNNNFEQRPVSARTRKVYRIKNPFQNRLEDTESEQVHTRDNDPGSSNQYASVQYSLPPEEFLQQLRAENQFYQQQETSTPSPNLGYTATPLPPQEYQYPSIQYSTPSAPTYENSNDRQYNNQIPLEPKSSHGPTYASTPSPYQFSTPNTFLDVVQSTPSPVSSYLSTPLNNGQYSSQPSAYVSSDSSLYVSSPTNQRHFVSSPMSLVHTGSHDYSGRVSTTIGHNPINYDNNEYSANRYQTNYQQSQNDYSTTTTTPSPYSEQFKEMWQNNINYGNNAAPKTDNAFNQYQNNDNKQQNTRFNTYTDNFNTDTHRIGSSITSPNNVFANYVHSDSQALGLKQTRDLDHAPSQMDLYSNGDFGWKLGKKLFHDVSTPTSYNRYASSSTGIPDDVAVSQMHFHMGTVKPYNYNQISKSTTDSFNHDFAQAAAKAHDRLKQQLQQQQQQQPQNYQYFNMNSYTGGNADVNNQGLSPYSHVDKLKNKFPDSNSNYYSYTTLQNDLVTASPYYFTTPKYSLDNKPKQLFDHDKALKNIVPIIDVSNVISTTEPKSLTNSYASVIYGKDQSDQNVKQFIRPVLDSLYKDKNNAYSFNIKTKPDDYSIFDSYKKQTYVYGKPLQTQESNYSHGYSLPQSVSYLGQPTNNYYDNVQSSSSQPPGLFRSQSTDMSNLLKFGDVPYKLTQSLSNDAFKFHNINYDQGRVPSPLPSRLNQYVGSHQLDVSSNLLNKFNLNKYPTFSINKPEIDNQNDGLMSTINGYKVANPYNVDLKLVAELLKGKPVVDDSQMLTFRDQYTNSSPLKFDFNSQLQYLLKNENTGNLMPMSDSLSALGSSYLDNYSNDRNPFSKYSRSQEEEETIVPIADASNSHPIGAVIEQDQDDTASESEVSAATEIPVPSEDEIHDDFEENRPKTHFLSRTVEEKRRHPNVLMSGQHPTQRKHPKLNLNEPYPLLKPPPRHHSSRGRNMKMGNKYNRRRRVFKPRLVRVGKTEPLFEAGADPENLDNSVSILLRPPVAEAKSDTVDTELSA